MTELTKRELEVVRAIRSGKKPGAIAERLCISGKTFDFHVRNIKAKLGLAGQSIAGIVEWALAHDIVGESGSNREKLEQVRAAVRAAESALYGKVAGQGLERDNLTYDGLSSIFWSQYKRRLQEIKDGRRLYQAPQGD